MNCEEVVELMQRELDGDLDDLEQARMREHLARCPDCAVLFSRLQKLSNELEQLPRVVPRYSLVDAILPQLERLAEAKDGRAGTFGSAFPDNGSVPAGPEQPEEAAERNGRSEAVRRAPERSWRLARDLWPRLASVAAFGVLIGVWLVNAPLSGPGPAARDNEAAQPLAGASSSEEAAELFSAPVEPPAAGDASPIEQPSKHLPAGELEFDTLKVAPGAADDVNGLPSRDASGRTGNPTPKAGAGNEGASDGNSGAVGGKAGPEPVPTEPVSGGSDPDTPVSHEISATPPAPNASAGTDPVREFSPDLAPEATKANILGLEQAPAEWVSPDGKWKVYAEDGVLKVANMADGSVVYQSAARKGAPADVEWQPGGEEIRVVWTDDAGEKTVFVVNLATGEESLIEPEHETTSDGAGTEKQTETRTEKRDG